MNRNSKCHYQEATSFSLTPIVAYLPASSTWCKTGLRAMIYWYWWLLNSWSVKLLKNENLVKCVCTQKQNQYVTAQSQLRTVVIYSSFNCFGTHSLFVIICICVVYVLPPNACGKYDHCKIGQKFCTLQCGRPVHLLFMYNIQLLVITKESPFLNVV